MAIIRIKRTTTTTVPPGLTFGEFAFMGQTGGTFANRVYIGDAQGNSVWVGAGITNGNVLNIEGGPSGSTANTTLTTIKGVYDLAAAIAGATLFTSNVTLNLSGTKSFGKYTTGQTIQSAGKSPIEVILDALVEYITMRIHLTPHTQANTILYGVSGNVSLGLTFSYHLLTPGYTANGSTLEWQQASNLAAAIANSGGWSTTSISTSPFHDTSAPFAEFPSVNGGGYTASATHTANITQWITTPYHYRYTIKDNSGQATGFTLAYNTITPQTFANPTATVSATGVTGTTTLTGVHLGEIGRRRERGNTGTSVNVTIAVGPNMSTTYHNIAEVGMQYSPNNGTNWYSTTHTENGINFVLVTPNVGSTGTTFTVNNPVNPAAGLTSMMFRFFAKEGLTANTGNGIQMNADGTNTYVSFRKRIFYGPTASVPTTASAVRSLPNSFLGPTSGTAIAAGIAGSTFNMVSGTQYSTFVIALPRGLTLNDNTKSIKGVVNIDANETLFGNSSQGNDSFNQISLAEATDVSGVTHGYAIYSMSLGDPYGSNQNLVVAFNGTIWSDETSAP